MSKISRGPGIGRWVAIFLITTMAGASFGQRTVSVCLNKFTSSLDPGVAKRFSMEDFNLRSLLAMGLLRDTSIRVSGISSDPRIVQPLSNFDFIINGSIKLYNEGFYIDLELTSRFGQKTTPPLVYGTYNQFYARVDDLVAGVVAIVKTPVDKRDPDGIRVITCVNRSSYDKLLAAPVARSIGKTYMRIVNDITGSVAESDSVYVVYTPLAHRADSINNLLLLNLQLDPQYNVVASPVLWSKTLDRQLELPDTWFSQSNFNNPHTELGIKRDLTELMDYLLDDDDEWDSAHVQEIASINRMTVETLRERCRQVLATGRIFSLLDEAHARRLLKINPEVAEAYLVVSLRQTMQNRFEDALITLQRGDRISYNSDMEALRGYVYLQVSNFPGALRSFKKVEQYSPSYDNPRLGNIQLLRGRAYLQMDSAGRALEAFDRARSMSPQSDTSINFFSAIALNKLRQYEKSIERLKASGNKLGQAATDLLLNNYTNLGLASFRDQNYRKALACFRKALEIKDDYWGNMNLFSTFTRLGLTKSADSLASLNLKRKMFTEKDIAIQQGVEFSSSANVETPGQSSEKANQQYIKYLQRNIDKHPNDAASMAELASLYFRQREFDRAIRSLRDAVKQSPNNVSYKLDLAEAYILTGKPEEADKLFPDSYLAEINRIDRSLFAVAVYLRLVANITLRDEGKTDVGIGKLMMEVERFQKNRVKIREWDNTYTDEYVDRYKGPGKESLQHITDIFKKMTVQSVAAKG